MSDTTPNTWDDVPMFPSDPVGPEPTTPAPARGGRPRTAGGDAAKLERKRQRDAERYAAQKAAKEAAGDPVARILDPETGAGRPTKLAAQSKVLTEQLAGMYELAGSIIMTGALILPALAPRLVAVGQALKVNANRCAASVVKYSESNDRVRRWLESAGGSSGLLVLALAHAPILMAAVGGRQQLVQADDQAAGIGAMLGDLGGMDLEQLGKLAGQFFPAFGVPVTPEAPPA